MKNISNLRCIEEATEHKALMAIIKNAATALMVQLSIAPEQNQLAFILGIPEARNNTQAISEWLLRQSKSSKIDNDSFPFLRRQLTGILEDCIRGN